MKRLGFAALTLLLLACAAPAVQAQVVLRGNASYRIYGDRVRVSVEDLTNLGATTTGRLRLMVWASEDPWEYFDPGNLIAFSLLPRLGPYQNYSDVRRTMSLHKPSTGWYYITVTLEERVLQDGVYRWVIRDKVEFDDQAYFWRRPSGWPFPF